MTKERATDSISGPFFLIKVCFLLTVVTLAFQASDVRIVELRRVVGTFSTNFLFTIAVMCTGLTFLASNS